jgi:hypothetical protein
LNNSVDCYNPREDPLSVAFRNNISPHNLFVYEPTPSPENPFPLYPWDLTLRSCDSVTVPQISSSPSVCDIPSPDEVENTFNLHAEDEEEEEVVVHESPIVKKAADKPSGSNGTTKTQTGTMGGRVKPDAVCKKVFRQMRKSFTAEFNTSGHGTGKHHWDHDKWL